MSRLKGRIAVVTGAASGMGRGAALKLASESAIVELLDRSDAGAVVEEIRKAGGQADSVLCDVTDEARISAAAKAVEGRRGRVDILVNNAGILSGRKAWHLLRTCGASQRVGKLMRRSKGAGVEYLDPGRILA